MPGSSLTWRGSRGEERESVSSGIGRHGPRTVPSFDDGVGHASEPGDADKPDDTEDRARKLFSYRMERKL